MCNVFYLLIECDTVRRARPFALRRANTLRPSGVDILSRKPCLFTLFLLEGWNVLFISRYVISLLFNFTDCKGSQFLLNNKRLQSFFIYSNISSPLIFSASPTASGRQHVSTCHRARFLSWQDKCISAQTPEAMTRLSILRTLRQQQICKTQQ